MKKRAGFWFLSILICSLILYGCGAGGMDKHTQSVYSVSTFAETAAAAGAYDIGFNDAAPNTTMDGGEFGEKAAADQEASLNPNTSTALPLERKLIRNMNLEVETTTFDELLQSVQAKVASLQGYIEQSDISGNSITNQGRPSKKYAHLVLRIPANNLNSFISQVENEGNVTYKSETVSDITLQYSDIESRLKTLRMEQERLWELLAQADTTEAIILLEERLTEVSSEIESSESRLRHFDNSVTYSTVYLNISEVDIESPTKPETAWQQIQRGFTRNLIDLMDALTGFFIGLLSNIPVIVFIGILAGIAVLIVKKIAKKRQKKQGFMQAKKNSSEIWRDERLKNQSPPQKESPNTDNSDTNPSADKNAENKDSDHNQN